MQDRSSSRSARHVWFSVALSVGLAAGQQIVVSCSTACAAGRPQSIKTMVIIARSRRPREKPRPGIRCRSSRSGLEWSGPTTCEAIMLSRS